LRASEDRKGRSQGDDSCWVIRSHVCILMSEQHLCIWSATTYTLTRTPGDVPPVAVCRSTSPTTCATHPVVICSELPNNPGGSITNSAEVIAAGVIRANELPTPLVWIEHWPEESADEHETFELVVFTSYEVTERAPYLGETRAWIGEPAWKALDRASVEVLVGRKV
jgi:hypothetical protein